jgi:hypothetical protein
MDSMRWGFAAFAVVLSWGAMGCSSSSAPAGASDGGDGGTTKDASQLSDVKDVVVEPLQPFDGQYGGDGGSPGTGTMLQPFYGAVLSGVTSDGWVVYGNGGEVPTYYAAPLDGGAAVDLGLSQSYGYTIVVGDVAFIFSSIDVDDGTYASPLSIWTSKNGEKLLTMNSFLENAAVSSDNNYVLYYDNLNPTAQTGDLYVAKTDGTGVTLLESSLPGLTPGGMCEPSFGFAGTTASVAWCPSGSTTSVTIATFPAPYTGTPSDGGADAGTGALVTGVTSLGFGVDPTFTYLSYVTSAGLNVVPLVGGTPTLIDATGTDGVFTTNGMNIFYATNVKDLDTSPVASPAENVLVTGGVDGVYGLSPNNATALVFSNLNSSNNLTDLYTASASTAGSLTKLTSSVTSTPAGFGILAGNPFTIDSSEVLFFTSVMASAEGSPFGALYVGNPSTGAATMLSGASNTVWATTGTKVVYSDSLLFLATTTMDILAVDVASGTPTLISHGATAGDSAAFYLSPAKDQIIYSWTSPGTESGGIFVAPVP